MNDKDDDDKGVSIFICRRRGSAPPCSVAGCGKPSVAKCDWPLGGKRAGSTCDRDLCRDCRTARPGGPDVDHCPAHAEMAKSKTP